MTDSGQKRSSVDPTRRWELFGADKKCTVFIRLYGIMVRVYRPSDVMVRASALILGGLYFEPRLNHTRGIENDMCYFLD